jgi:mutator protein MutT
MSENSSRGADAPPPYELIVVAAAVIERDGAFLLTRRLKGTHLAGTWEFPGGKCEPHETLQACLAREIREELGTGIAVGEPMLTTRHAYPERTVELHFFRGTLDGDPVPQLGQQMRWVPRSGLSMLPLPEADAGLIELLLRDGR